MGLRGRIWELGVSGSVAALPVRLAASVWTAVPVPELPAGGWVVTDFEVLLSKLWQAADAG